MRLLKKYLPNSKFIRMLGQAPVGIGRQLFIYGVPVLAFLLVISVVVVSIFVKNPDETKTQFAKVEAQANEIEPLAKVEAPVVAKDLAQVKRDLNAQTLHKLVENSTGIGSPVTEPKQPEVKPAFEEVPAETTATTQAKESVAEETAKTEESKPQESSAASETEVAATTAATEPATTQGDEPAPSETSAPTAAAYEETWVYKYVNTIQLNVRSNASFDAEVLKHLHQGDVVTELATNGIWSKILLEDGKVGFVYNYYLTTEFVAAPAQQAPEQAVASSEFTEVTGTKYIAVGSANVRAGATVDSNAVTHYYYGDAVTLLAYGKGWYKVSGSDSQVGFIREDLLRDDPVPASELRGEEGYSSSGNVTVGTPSESAPAPTSPPEEPTAAPVPEEPAPTTPAEPAPAPEPQPEPTPEPAPAPVPETPPATSGAQQAVNLALSYVGYPYVFGGSSPGSGFDCSGLVQYCIQAAGGTIGRTTYAQVSYGIEVPYTYGDFSNVMPGDVLLFAESGQGIFHAGLYIGNGQFVHAVNPSTGVIVDSVYGGWNLPRIAYIRRIFY